jgi:hypothetical protein
MHDALTRAIQHSRAHNCDDPVAMRQLASEIFAATTLTLAAILALAPGVRASDIMVNRGLAGASSVFAAETGETAVKVPVGAVTTGHDHPEGTSGGCVAPRNGLSASSSVRMRQ